MFWRNLKKGKLEQELDELKLEAERAIKEISILKQEKRNLQEQVETLKFKTRLEAEEIKHNMRLAEEAAKNTLESEKIKLQEQYAKDTNRFQDEQRKILIESLKEFHTKIETRFNQELNNMKDIYNMLTKKLPDVNFAFTKDLDSKPKKLKSIEAK